MNLVPRFKLWLEVDGKTVMSEGRVRLLEEIEKCGSLSQAARNRGISYRHAYNLIGSLNRRFGIDILESSIGGKRGGGTRLTEAGKRLLADFTALRAEMELTVATHRTVFRT